MSHAQTLIDAIAVDAARTRKLLAALPVEHFAYTPHDKSMSLGQLAGHLAETPAWLGAMLEPEMDMAAGMDDWTPFVPETHEQLMKAFDENLANVGALLGDKDDAFLEAEWVMRMGDKELMRDTRERVIRDILIHHQAHHRGQLTVYMRLLDLAVPATFGDSADERVFQPG